VPSAVRCYSFPEPALIIPVRAKVPGSGVGKLEDPFCGFAEYLPTTMADVIRGLEGRLARLA